MLFVFALAGISVFATLNNGELLSVNGEIEYSEEYGYKIAKLNQNVSLKLPYRPTASLESGEVFVNDHTFVSEWIESDTSFHSVAVNWKQNGSGATLFLRSKLHNEKPSEWVLIEADIDDFSSTDATEKNAFLQTAYSNKLQYKFEMETENASESPLIDGVNFTFIDGTEFADLSKADFSLDESLSIVSRQKWGANEDVRLHKDADAPILVENDEEIEMRYADELKLSKVVERDEYGRVLKWPLQYPEKPIKAIFVHHTASEVNALSDSYATMRAIYYYHAVVRGWGDIGYNYLIDANGNIFEGRFGGKGVVGAHTANFNVGSIGIAVIGNYQNKEIEYSALKSLTSLLSKLSLENGLNPIGYTTMRGENISVISGHRDAGRTQCPGESLYSKLFQIRHLVSAGFKSGKVINNEYEVVDDFSIVSLKPDEVKTVQLRLKNNSQEPWGRKTSLVIKNTENNVAGVDRVVGRLKEVNVAPGKVGTFAIPLKGNNSSGLKNYYLYLENNNNISVNSFVFPVFAETPVISFELVEIQQKLKVSLDKNEKVETTLKLKNTGNSTWYKESMSVYATGGFTVEGEMTTPSVAPNATGIFNVSFTAGNVSGAAKINVGLRLKATSLDLQSINTTQFVFSVLGSDKALTGVTAITGFSENVFVAGQTKRVWIEVENATKSMWLKTGKEKLSISAMKSAQIGVKNIYLDNGRVNVGAKGRIYFDVTAPKKEGKYFINFTLRDGGLSVSKSPLRYEFTVAENSRTVGTVNKDEIKVNNINKSLTTAVTTPVATTSIQGTVDGKLIRVRLSFDGKPVIYSEGKIYVEVDGKRLLAISEGQAISTDYRDGKYFIQYGNESKSFDSHVKLIAENNLLKISNYENRPQWNNLLNDNEFRGAVEIRYLDDEKKLVTINELKLGDYLKGIAEVSNSDPYEKLKTMSVLARSYAYYYISKDVKFPGKPYNLDDSPERSQKYVGYGVEKRSPNVVRAVKDTANQVVTYNGEVVKTPYFNASDGKATKSAKEVWGWDNTPYLQSVPDPLCTSTQFNGHGVGLSGCGATEAAKKGYTYQDIIKYYYKDVVILNK